MKTLIFEQKDIGEMTKKEFIDYYNNKWFPFMKEVSAYGESLNALSKILGLSK